MKKLLILFTIFISLGSSAQDPTLDTAGKQSLELRLKDWAWGIDKRGNQMSQDSVLNIIMVTILKKIKDTVSVYGRFAAKEKLCKIDSIPATAIVAMYHDFSTEQNGVVWEMGTTQLERQFIGARIQALTNGAIQFYIDRIDQQKKTSYEDALLRTYKMTAAPY